MRGRQPGRSIKWVHASVEQVFDLNRNGVSFEVWSKWKRTDKKVGTLIVNSSGVRWLPANGKVFRRRRWDKLAEWLSS